MFTKRETDGDQVGVVVDRLHHMATYIRPAGTSTATTCTDIVDVQIE